MQTEKKHNYFYRITNQLDWKYYFGIHSTDDLNDGYFGNGRFLKRAIKKHGKENFVKIIISDYPTRKEASDHEKIVVDLYMIKNEMCYNVKTGGENQGTYFHTNETKEKISKSLKGRSPSPETLEKIKLRNKDNCIKGPDHRWYGKPGLFLGKHHTEETKRKISESNTGQKRSIECIEKIRQKAIGRIHSDETKKIIAKKCLGNNHAIKRPCIIEGTIFESIVSARKFLNISKGTIDYRLNSKLTWLDWKYLDEINEE